ncbi:MAG: S8 family peptidase [Saprospiraceae bacterium]|nr:S8 family peptidase [Saprospiraceae bacterium]
MSSQNEDYHKIDKSLLTRFDNVDIAEYVILMKTRKVFDAALPGKTKSEKAHYVYTSLVSMATKTQKPIIEYLKNNNIPHQSFYVTNAIKVSSGIDVLQYLASRTDIEKILDNASFRVDDYTVERNIPASRSVEPEWGIRMIKADSVWQVGYRGQGVVIAGQDTGYDWSVSPLKNKYRGTIDSTTTDHNYNWHDAIVKNNPTFPDSVLNPCGYTLQQPCDDLDHGTHTMGTMVGEDADNSIGVSPDSRWMGCRNMDRGWGQLSTYIECFEWFLAPYDLDGKNASPDKAPHVINNSWYCSSQEGCNLSNWIVFKEVIYNLKASGVVVVVSAGNSGGAGCGSVSGPPAIFEPSFSIGATNDQDLIAGFSSRGPVTVDSSFILKPNVSAPGVNVRSVIRGGIFANYNGTSMAGPHVAGLVGLIISANPDLAGQVDIIEDIIEATAMPIESSQDCGDFPGSTIPNAAYGYGRIDALAAVKMARKFISGTNQHGSDQSLHVFPNPVEDLITFKVTEGNSTLNQIIIFDTNGKILKQSFEQNDHILSTMDVHSLPDGIYFYEVKNRHHTWNGKFVKM